MRRRLAVLRGSGAVDKIFDNTSFRGAAVELPTRSPDAVDERLGPGVALAEEAEPAYDAAHPHLFPGLLMRHRAFLLSVSVGMAALYGELGFFSYHYYANATLDQNRAGLAIGGLFLLTLLGYVAALIVPHLLYRMRYDLYNPIVFLFKELTLSIGIILTTSLANLALNIVLVGPDNLGAIAEIIRSLTLYTIVGGLVFHGLVIYIRYVQYLYLHQIHESYKVVGMAAALTFLLLIITLYLLPFDLGRMGMDGANAGLLSLHLTVRDVGLISLTLYIFFWHAATLADH